MNILLVDDQNTHLEYLEILLRKLALDNLKITSSQQPLEAIKRLRKEHFDLLFLDVEMPEITGFEFIDIVGLENLPPLIFTTAYSKYAVEAFKVNAIDYLLKPFELSELAKSVEKAKTFQNSVNALQSIINQPPVTNEERLVIIQGQTYLFVPYTDIIRIEGKGSYADFYLLDGQRITTSKRLNIYWNQLNQHHFFKPHKSHIVNQTHVVGYSKSEGGMLLLSNGQNVPVSDQLKEEIRQRFKF